MVVPCTARETAPTFVERLAPRWTVTEGEPVRMSVRVSGVPKPVVTWHRNNSVITSSPDFELLENTDVYTLNIQEVFLDDAGSFTMTAENRLGRVSCTTELLVKRRTFL